MPVNCSPAIIAINISNRSWHINAHKTFSQIWDKHRLHIFSPKTKWFYKWTLNWKVHLFYFVLVKKKFCIRSPDTKLRIPPSAWRKAEFYDLCLPALPLTFGCELTLKNFPTQAFLNQFCSFLSTSTSISLRLNFSDLLLLLETSNKHEILFVLLFGSKKFRIRLSDTKKTNIHTFSSTWVNKWSPCQKRALSIATYERNFLYCKGVL